jgi:hypothetical protein
MFRWRLVPRPRPRRGLTSPGARATPCPRSRSLRDAAFKACVGLLTKCGTEGRAALAAEPAFVAAACRMVGSCIADSLYVSLTALSSLGQDCSTPPAGEGRSLLAASLRAGDLEALAGGLAKAVRDYVPVGNSLPAHDNEPLRGAAVRVLKLAAWLLADPGLGDGAARAMPPGAALHIGALALGVPGADPRDVSWGRCALGRGRRGRGPGSSHDRRACRRRFTPSHISVRVAPANPRVSADTGRRDARRPAPAAVPRRTSCGDLLAAPWTS